MMNKHQVMNKLKISILKSDATSVIVIPKNLIADISESYLISDRH